MKKILLLSFFTLFLVSCGGTKHTRPYSHTSPNQNSLKTKTERKVRPHQNTRLADLDFEEEPESSGLIKQEIIDFAKTFQGTRYKYGGTTEAGMDCSGLICVAFKKENISLPRISRDMATQGIPVSLKNVEEGDLVFFKTSRRNVISHVGLVVEAKHGQVKFIHSTTSAGVIISSLDEKYWKKAFAEIRRVI
ncbi:C40 family peptidase [Aequorivita marina]|uniref:C40 family peptidase n=1 Tax=Aequorivita marina TaxID=3073654 RepID=UPI002875ED16|nr:C40 family peptidase [Aequorivita sp. S2608]MDS1296886.1 C40 family peptidase [Aequorivita sp. S2608]